MFQVELFVICKGISMGDFIIVIYYFICVDDQIYEFYGYLSIIKLIYKE